MKLSINLFRFFFYIIASIYVFSTIFVAYKVNIWLPSSDLVMTPGILFDAYINGIGLAIFDLYNEFHWIVIPKLILSLDMILFKGSSVFIKISSVFFLLATIFILAFVISKYSQLHNKKLVIFFMAAMMGGPWVIESLLNPVSQYTMICFFLVLFSYFVCFVDKKLYLLVGSSASAVCLIMSSGQLVALLPVAILCFFRNSDGIRNFYILLLVMAVFVISLDAFLVYVLSSEPLPILVYRLVYSSEAVGFVSNMYWSDPSGFYFYFYNSIFYFISKLVFPHLNELIYESYLKFLSISFFGLVSLFFFKKRNDNYSFFWVMCFLYLALFSVIPAFLRLADGYTNRFSNAGALMFFSGCMLVSCYASERFFKGFLLFWILSLFACIPISYKNIERQLHGILGSATVMSQVAYSVGINHHEIIMRRMGSYFGFLDVDKTYAFLPLWKKNNIGVFSSDSYKVFAGQLPLPIEEKHCEYELQGDWWKYWEAENEFAVRVKGLAQADSKYLTDLVFYHDGNVIGRAVEDVQKDFYSLLFKPASWDGFIKLDSDAAITITAVAYNDKFRCQSWNFKLNP